MLNTLTTSRENIAGTEGLPFRSSRLPVESGAMRTKRPIKYYFRIATSLTNEDKENKGNCYSVF